MIEQRELTKAEFYTLLESCPEQESDALINYVMQIGKKPWDFFQELGLGSWGIVIDNVPIYFACVYDEGDDTYRMWTLNKENIKEQFTLFKLCKRRLDKAVKVWHPIYAINYTDNKLVSKWNMRMGFLPYKVENNLVYYKLGG